MGRKTKTLEKTPARFAVGQRVTVTEQGIRPWCGIVSDVKWSPVSGWWLGIIRDDGGSYSMPEEVVG